MASPSFRDPRISMRARHLKKGREDGEVEMRGEEKEEGESRKLML